MQLIFYTNNTEAVRNAQNLGGKHRLSSEILLRLTAACHDRLLWIPMMNDWVERRLDSQRRFIKFNSCIKHGDIIGLDSEIKTRESIFKCTKF